MEINTQQKQTMKTRPFQEVVSYRTADGALHASEQAATEHAEDLASRALDQFFASVPGMGAQMQYRLTCHAIKNAEQLAAILKPLNYYNEDTETD